MIEKEYIDLEEAAATLKRNSLKCFNSYYKGYVNAIKDLTNLFDENLKSEFCPWCGARMDGEEK